MATDNNNREKEVLIKVKTETSESSKSIDELKSKIKSTSSTAREMDRLDYGKLSVKDLKKELDKAEQSMEQLAKSGNATDGALEVIGQRVDTINNSLKEIKTDKAYEVFRGQVRGATGAIMAMEGAMATLGIESKSFEQTVQTIMGIRAFRRGLDDLIKYRKDMLKLIGVTNKQTVASEAQATATSKVAVATTAQTASTEAQATATNKATIATRAQTVASKALRVSLSALGIGLLVSALSYLITNWERVRDTIFQLIPGLEGVSKWFSKLTGGGDKLKAVFMGVGRAVITYLISPLKTAGKVISNLLKGNFEEAGKALNPANLFSDIAKSYKKGYIDEIARQDEEASKKRIADIKDVSLKEIKNKKDTAKKINNETKKQVDEEKKLRETLSKYIEEAERAILEDTTEARKLELMDVDAKYTERIALAEKLGKDTTALEEAQRIEVDAINKKYDDKELEDKKKFEEEALKIEEEAKKKRLETASLTGETGVIEAENMDDGTVEGLTRITGARQAALLERYVAERKLYADDQEMLNNLKAKYNKESLAIEEEHNEGQRKISEATKNAKIDDMMSVSNAMGAISNLLGEQTVAGKSLGVAQATIDTYVGANKAIAQGGIAGIAMAGSVIATGLANVKKILSTKIKGIKGGSSSSTGGNTPRTAPSAPVINTTVLNRPEDEDLNSLGSNENTTPLRAYIVDKDLDKNADKKDLTEQLSTF